MERELSPEEIYEFIEQGLHSVETLESIADYIYASKRSGLSSQQTNRLLDEAERQITRLTGKPPEMARQILEQSLIKLEESKNI